MEITVEELNKLLEKEFERGRNSVQSSITYIPKWDITPVKTKYTVCQTSEGHIDSSSYKDDFTVHC